MYEYIRLVKAFRPKWIVWENVPGALSSGGGRDFGTFLTALAQFGYGLAYRVLDSQYFGVPQKRRRVFVVGCFGDAKSAFDVLFKQRSGGGNSEKSGKARKNGSSEAKTSIGKHGRVGTLGASSDRVCPREDSPQAFTQNSREEVRFIGGDGQKVGALMACGGTHKTNYILDHQLAGTLCARDYKGIASDDIAKGSQKMVVEREYAAPITKANGECWENRKTFTAMTSTQGGQLGQGRMAVRIDYKVRRLTPKECERLQGFPDDYTQIAWNGKAKEDCPNGLRYKALGNSMAVPVMRWIGERIMHVEGIPLPIDVTPLLEKYGIEVPIYVAKVINHTVQLMLGWGDPLPGMAKDWIDHPLFLSKSFLRCQLDSKKMSADELDLVLEHILMCSRKTLKRGK